MVVMVITSFWIFKSKSVLVCPAEHRLITSEGMLLLLILTGPNKSRDWPLPKPPYQGMQRPIDRDLKKTKQESPSSAHTKSRKNRCCPPFTQRTQVDPSSCCCTRLSQRSLPIPEGVTFMKNKIKKSA